MHQPEGCRWPLLADPEAAAVAFGAEAAAAAAELQRAIQRAAAAFGQAAAARMARRLADALAPAPRRRGRPAGARLRGQERHILAAYHEAAAGLDPAELRRLPLRLARRLARGGGAEALARRIRHLVKAEAAAKAAAAEAAARRAEAEKSERRNYQAQIAANWAAAGL